MAGRPAKPKNEDIECAVEVAEDKSREIASKKLKDYKLVLCWYFPYSGMTNIMNEVYSGYVNQMNFIIEGETFVDKVENLKKALRQNYHMEIDARYVNRNAESARKSMNKGIDIIGDMLFERLTAVDISVGPDNVKELYDNPIGTTFRVFRSSPGSSKLNCVKHGDSTYLRS